MLQKDVDWSILAQCDFYAVQKIIQTPDRIAMRTIEPMREVTFERKLKQQKWKKAYEIVCAAHQKLHPTFSIAHNNYGGYRLLYNGKDTVRPPAVFRRKTLGFVREVPEGVATNLSIMSSQRRKAASPARADALCKFGLQPKLRV